MMKTQLFLALCLVAAARCRQVQQQQQEEAQQVLQKEAKGGDTTTESDPLISSLENIVNRVKSMKERVEKTLNETAAGVLEKSHHEFLIARGYTFTSGVGYHKLYLAELSWKEAMHKCRQEKAHLAVVDTLAERKAIGDLIKKRVDMLQGVDSLKAYVGVHDYCKNGWVTIFFDVLDDDAEHVQWKVDYTGGDAKGGSASPSCVVIDDEEYFSAVRCGKKQPFICEMESP